MADQRPWIKLWKSFRSDPDIKRLGVEGMGRWMLLLLFVAEHGREGVWSGPMHSLVHALTFTGNGERARRRAGQFLARLPGVTVTVKGVATGWPQGGHERAPEHTVSTPIEHGEQGSLTHDPLTVTVTFRNWAKYQESNSVHRTRRWRGKRHGDGQSASQASPPEASHASPNVTRSRSRRDKNPLTPVRIGSPATQLPDYPEPEPGAHKVAMASLKDILANAKPISPPPPEATPTTNHKPRHPIPGVHDEADSTDTPPQPSDETSAAAADPQTTKPGRLPW